MSFLKELDWFCQNYIRFLSELHQSFLSEFISSTGLDQFVVSSQNLSNLSLVIKMTWSRRNCTYLPFFPRLTLNIDWIIFQDTIDSNCTEIFRMSPEMGVIFLDFQEEMV